MEGGQQQGQADRGRGSSDLPFAIVIEACRDYAPVALPVLLDSLETAGAPLDSVVVVCGQCEAERGEDAALDAVEDRVIRGGGRFERRKYTTVCATALVAVSEDPALVSKPWFLHLQCTTSVGARFVDLARDVYYDLSGRPGLDCIKLLDRFSMNMGFYRTAWVRGLASELARHKRGGADAPTAADVHEVRDIKTWCEDLVFGMCSPAAAECLGRYADAEAVQFRGWFKYREDGQPRVHEYYPSLDLHKYKSWFGQAVDAYDTPDGRRRRRIPVGV